MEHFEILWCFSVRRSAKIQSPDNRRDAASSAASSLLVYGYLRIFSIMSIAPLDLFISRWFDCEIEAVEMLKNRF